MNYLLLKYFHIFCVASSFALFFVRGMWMMRAYPPAQERWAKVLPHIVDALLVLTAVGMIAIAPKLGLPVWLQVKIGLLVVYVLLVLVVFRLGRNRLQKGAAWLAGLALFLFVTTVAVLRHPLGILSVL